MENNNIIYSTDVWVSFNYGGWSIIFSKEFDLPFVPFHSMTLFDETNEYENNVDFYTNESTYTTIMYRHPKNSFVVDVNNTWKFPVDSETIDETIKIFTDTEWTRQDTTDLTALKDLMLKDSDRFK